jgi:hypothetical protein
VSDLCSSHINPVSDQSIRTGKQIENDYKWSQISFSGDDENILELDYVHECTALLTLKLIYC